MTGNAFGWRMWLPLLGALLVSGASVAADPSEGRRLAEQWCASCHAIAPGQASSELVPPFASIVRDRGRSTEWLSTWLSTPHEAMPDLSLTRQEIADLAAFLDSLR
jgi:mono/diheme cytochrome c family protein